MNNESFFLVSKPQFASVEHALPLSHYGHASKTSSESSADQRRNSFGSYKIWKEWNFILSAYLKYNFEPNN